MITIGASLFPAVVGVSPFLTPYDAWKILKHGYQPPPTEATEVGSLLEDDVLELYRRRHKTVLSNFQVSVVRGIFHATIDAWDEYSSNIVEAKTSVRRVKELPLYYYLQVQMQMYCHQVDKAVVAYLSSMRYTEFPVEYDEAFLKPYREKAEDFYEQYIVGTKEPPNVVLNEGPILWKDDKVVAEPAQQEMIMRCLEIEQSIEMYQHAIDELEGEYNAIMQQLVRQLDGAAQLVFPDGRVVLQRCERTIPGRLDVNAIKQNEPDIYNKYYIQPSSKVYYRLVYDRQ